MNPAVAHIGLEGSYHSYWMDIQDVPVDSAESLQILAESLSFFLLEKLQVVGPSWFLMAAREGANELMAQVSPQRNGVLWQVHQPRPHIGLECQREVVGKYLLIYSSGSLHSDGIDAQELCRVQPSIILF